MDQVGTYWREVWSLRGAYWSLPLGVEWPEGQRDMAAIRIGAGIRLLDIQRQAAEARLLAIGGQFYNNRWFVLRAQLEKFCKPEGFVDPQTVVEWRPMERVRYRPAPMSGDPQTNALKFRGRDEFFHAFCLTGWMSNPYKADLLFTAFCRHMLHWLVNEQRPVDLGFCTLLPVPLRPNWKSLLLDRHRGRVLPTSKVGLMREIAEEVLKKPEYTVWYRLRKRIFWNLECLPERPWYRATMEYERKRKAVHEKEFSRYVSAVRDTIRRSLPSLTRLYDNYLTFVKRPGARLMAVVTTTREASKVAGNRRGALVRVDPARVVPAYDYLDPVDPVEIPDDSDAATGDVRTVPDLPPGVEDMRQPSDVAEPKDGA